MIIFFLKWLWKKRKVRVAETFLVILVRYEKLSWDVEIRFYVLCGIYPLGTIDTGPI